MAVSYDFGGWRVIVEEVPLWNCTIVFSTGFREAANQH